MEGIKVEWSSDSDKGLASNALRHKRRKTRKSRMTKVHTKPTQASDSSDEDSALNNRITSRERPVSAASKKHRESAHLQTESEAEAVQMGFDKGDEISVYLPAHMQWRIRKARQHLANSSGAPIRLPPTRDPGRQTYMQDIRVKPMFVNAKPCNANEDLVLHSRGFEPQSDENTPAHFIGTLPGCIARWLRPYQIQGAHFLLERFVWQRGCILGDDMGLGKTIQVIAFLTAAFGKSGSSEDTHHRQDVRKADPTNWYPKVLIVCPGTLMDNWSNELDTWGFWQVDRFHGSSTEKDAVLRAARSGSVEIVLTTYHTYRNHRNQINLIEWDCVVADECHHIKEREALITVAMDSVNALCRIGLTGTAIQNTYNELWTLLNWSNPGAVSSYTSWKKLISKPLQHGQAHNATTREHGIARRTALALKNELLPRFFLRRWKSLIADQLPRKSDRVVFCPLTDLQQQAYKSFLNSPLVGYIRDAGNDCPCGSGKKAGWCCRQFVDNDPERPWKIYTFPAIQALKNLSNHLALLLPESIHDIEKYNRALEIVRAALPDHWTLMMQQKDSIFNLNNRSYCGKFEVLLKLLAWWHERGDKVLIFSHSVKLLRGLHLLFSTTSYSCSYLDGSMAYQDRTREVTNFNSDVQQFVFLISTRAGGVGLNITSANKVVILDPNWNPSHDLQAQDRAYRIGQIRDVDVFRLVSIGTVEEMVYARQIYKQQQASIGYNASLERRYFSGVQGNQDKKGELFGLGNLLTFREGVMLQDIVNKTNVAESKAGLLVAEADFDTRSEQLDDDARSEGIASARGNEIADDVSHDPSVKAVADVLNLRGRKPGGSQPSGSNDPITANANAIEHILTQAGVQYFHENAEVIGTSKIESKLSRRAMRDVEDDDAHEEVIFDNSAMGENSNVKHTTAERARSFEFRPSEDIRVRQFCTMAKFAELSTVRFAMRVESWTQRNRQEFLDAFYAWRAQYLDR